MESSIAYIVSAITATAAEYSRRSLQWNHDIRMECLCWSILYLGLKLRPKVLNLPAEESGDGLLPQKQQSNFNWTTWTTSLLIAVARVLSVQYDTTLAMPLTVVLTSLALFYRDSPWATLPEPAGHTRLSRPKPRLEDILQFSFLGLLGVLSIFLISKVFNGGSILILCLFILARSSGFFLLHTFQDYNQLSIYRVAEAIVLRVSLVLMGVLLIVPSSSILGWPMVLQALCSSVALGATLYLVLGGHTLPAMTIDSYSAAAIESLQAGILSESLISPLISVISLGLGTGHLPPSTMRRKILVLVIIPILPILTGNSALWHAHSSQSQSNWHIDSSQSLPNFEPSIHPIRHLAAKADHEFHAMVKKQSRTLDACCREYERRYGRKPPPHFDQWFRAAQKQDFLLMDEFDSMMANMEPLWGVAPSDIRARLDSMIDASHGQGMYRFTVSHSENPIFNNPENWMGSTFSYWFDSEVLQTLPDMALVVNTMDEPKVVVPYDMLSRALEIARTPREGPLLPGKKPELAQHVDLLDIGKQNTWDAFSLSCPPDTVARDFSLQANDSPFLSEMGFLSNLTLSKDVCQFPELHNIHAGLRHPSSMTITHSLVPVFSQAKASCFNDLLYPSPFYAEKLRTGEYKEQYDMDWEQKDNIVYWTGSNTGGYSTSENWRSFQRQRLALMTLNESQPVKLLKLTQQPGEGGLEWVPIESTIAEISNYTRVRISAAIQCDYAACKEQEDELHIQSGVRDDITDGYKARYNIDIDGNGLSGRFYRLLMSKSTVLKQTLYQEWHDDWLIPWFHYIPISMDLRDFPEIVRYLTQEPEGQALGRKVAENSYSWSRRVLRTEDMRLVWWRLMLEYGRLVSDDREKMWYKDY